MASKFKPDLSALPTSTVLVPVNDYDFQVKAAEFKSGISKKNDKYWGMLVLTLVYLDPEIKQLLSMDEPRARATVSLRFNDDETLADNNPDLGGLLEFLGLKDDPEQFDTNTDDAETAKEFNEIYFDNIAKALVGSQVKAHVAQIPHHSQADKMQNEVTYFIYE